MNKAQLIDVVAKNTNVTKKDTEAVLNALTAAITDALKEGDKVEWVYTCDLGRDVGGNYAAKNGE